MIRIILESLIAFVSVYFFAILLEAPKRALLHSAITGSLGWFVYLVGLEFLEKIPATLLAAVVISFLSHYFARYLKTPATVYFLPGFIPLVPGEAVYRAVFSFINGDYGEGQLRLSEALLISGAIAVAIFIVDAIFSLQTRLKMIKIVKQEEENM